MSEPPAERTTLAYARSWPATLPLDEAAAFLGMKPDALRQRFRRGKQPGAWQGRRVFITLTPAQWADWSLTSPRSVAVERTPEPLVHPAPTRHEAAAPTTGQEGVLVLLAQLEAARQREVELAGMVGWLQRKVQELEERQAFAPSPALPNEHPGEQATLPQPVPWWHTPLRRLVPWLAPASPRSSLAPAPSQSR